MKALTVWQPWASAIALGYKSIETRGWSTKYRGPLIIHAAARPVDPMYCPACSYPDEACRLCDDGRTADLPTGAALCVVSLINVVPTDVLLEKVHLDPLERRLGNYGAGRYGWMLDDVRVFDPVPAAGKQRLWNPDPVLREVAGKAMWGAD